MGRQAQSAVDDADMIKVREFSRRAKLAAQDFMDEPFNDSYRTLLVELLVHGTTDADGAMKRLRRRLA